MLPTWAGVFFYFFFQNLSIFLFDIGIPLFYRAFSTHGKNDILVLNFEAVLLIVRLKDKEVLLSPDIHRLTSSMQTM